MNPQAERRKAEVERPTTLPPRPYLLIVPLPMSLRGPFSFKPPQLDFKILLNI